MPSTASDSEDLFVTWQRARKLTHVPVTRALVARFLAEVPAGAQYVRKLFDVPDVSVFEVIRSTPKYGGVRNRVTGGLWGRRDAVIVWLHHIGFTRSDIHSLRTGDLVAAADVFPYREPEQVCPACVLARWLSVLALLPPLGGRLAALNHVSTRGQEGHACHRQPPAEWERAYAPLPAIDQHGWAADVNLSPRAITAVLALRKQGAGNHTPETKAPRRQLSPEHIAELLDELDDLTSLLAQRIAD